MNHCADDGEGDVGTALLQAILKALWPFEANERAKSLFATEKSHRKDDQEN